MDKIRKIPIFIFTFLLMAGLSRMPVRASAATMDSAAGAVTTSGSRLNIRSKASTGAPVMASLPKGSHVTLVSQSGSWWYVEYAKGKYGYCHGDYITAIAGSPVKVVTQSGSLNVRSGAGTSYGKIASLQKGEVVLELSSSGGWSRVLYHGTQTGYVSSRYLSKTYQTVRLNVPSFKQTDSRWSGIQIGESGKTFHQIGCATTAIAMMESYRTGTTIYPDAMARQLRYTPSGSVYWPEHYMAVTNSSGFLSAIYNKLRQGKPILFGATNSYGKQHWVVINGFAGGNTLTASGFAILDPGSASRSNLQQFLNEYPNIYKYFYYSSVRFCTYWIW